MFEKKNILIPFFEEPNRKYHLRELAKLLKLSPATVKKNIEYFLKTNLVKEKRERNLRLFGANLESKIFREYKKFYTIMKILNSGLLEKLVDEFLFPTVILFGSAAKGEDFKNSDVDIFVLSNSKKETNLEKFEKQIRRKIQLFVMNSEELSQLAKKNPELFNNIVNGIKLEGFLKVVK